MQCTVAPESMIERLRFLVGLGFSTRFIYRVESPVYVSHRWLLIARDTCFICRDREIGIWRSSCEVKQAAIRQRLNSDDEMKRDI